MNRVGLKALKENTANKLGLGLALALAATLLFTNISKASFWHDEGYTMMLAPMSPAEIISRTAKDVHPPLYYLKLHFWMELFGSNELGARSFSAICVLGIVIAGFLLCKRLFGSPTARLAALFLATAPFLVRYGQEARMYALVALLLLLATLVLHQALEKDRTWQWALYAVLIAASLYTHYYSVFIIFVHWSYVVLTGGIKKSKWWGANIFALALFAPWVPSAYEQFTRVQVAFWIPKATALTIPSTLAQYLTFTDLGVITPLWRITAFTIFQLFIALVMWQNRKKWQPWLLITAYAFWAPQIVWLLSYKRPVYVDRYFVFSSIAFYCLLAALIYFAKPWNKKPALRAVTILGLLVTMGVGVRNVYSQASHQMRNLAAAVHTDFKPGDKIVSGELYTFFDYSYYNRTGSETLLYSPSGFSGCCEGRSLLYDKPQILVRSFSDITSPTSTVWVIGKTGTHDYFDNVPSNWQPVGARVERGYVAAQKYQLSR